MDQYPSYINVNSNHLNAIIKQVPKAFHMRIRRLSSSKKIFQNSSKMYMEALKSSGFREEFTYHEPKIPDKNNLYMNKENMKCIKKNRKRKIIWFCHVVSHWDDRNKITTILLFELTVASHQRMTVKKECGSQVLGDLPRIAWHEKEEERSQMIGWDPKTEVGTPSRQRK